MVFSCRRAHINGIADGLETGSEMTKENTQSQENNEGSGEAEKMLSQTEVNALIAQTVKREREKADADREKAEKYDELLEAQKTEQQKLIERAEKAESKIKAMEAAEKIAALRIEIAEEVEVPASLVRGDSEKEIREHAEALKEELGATSSYVDDDGHVPDKSLEGSAEEAFVSMLEGTQKG